MGIRFDSRHVTSLLHDPRAGFEPRESRIEIRRDPLTERTVRLLSPRGILPPRPQRKAPLEDLLGSGDRCPFCEPRVHTATPTSPLLGNAGRLTVGEACLFPNLYPFGLESAVCVYTTTHDLKLLEFPDLRVVNAFRACRDFCHLATREHDRPLQTAIYSNYLSPSGSSIDHPHLQVLADPEALTLARLTADGVERHLARTGGRFFEELVASEEEEGRLVARLRHFDWIAPFAPLGMMHLHAVGREPMALEELTDHLIEDLVDGLLRVFRYYRSQQVDSLNLILFGSPRADQDERRFPLQLHAVVRPPVAPHYRNDATALEHLYGETGIDLPPETVARDARAEFSDI